MTVTKARVLLLAVAVLGCAALVGRVPAPRGLAAGRPSTTRAASATSAAALPFDVSTYPATAAGRRLVIRALYAPIGRHGVKAVRAKVRVDWLTTLEMSTHLRALVIKSAPSVEDVHDMMAMLPYSLRYDVVDKHVICPYAQIVELMVWWTPVDGRNQYDQGKSGLVQHAEREFELRRLHPEATAESFEREWRTSLPRILEDMAFLEKWYEKRRKGLRIGAIYEIRQTVRGATGQPVQVRTEEVGRRTVVYHPDFDRCDPAKWYRPALFVPLKK